MLEQVQALWRPLTAFVMAAVVLAISLGFLPAEAEAHANSILTTAGSVLSVLAVSRGLQRVQEVKAQAAPMGVLLEGLSMVKPADPGAAQAVVDEVRAIREEIAMLRARL